MPADESSLDAVKLPSNTVRTVESKDPSVHTKALTDQPEPTSPPNKGSGSLGDDESMTSHLTSEKELDKDAKSRKFEESRKAQRDQEFSWWLLATDSVSHPGEQNTA